MLVLVTCSVPLVVMRLVHLRRHFPLFTSKLPVHAVLTAPLASPVPPHHLVSVSDFYVCLLPVRNDFQAIPSTASNTLDPSRSPVITSGLRLTPNGPISITSQVRLALPVNVRQHLVARGNAVMEILSCFYSATL